MKKGSSKNTQRVLVGLAFGLLLGVIVVDQISPHGSVPGAFYVSLAILSAASRAKRLTVLASTAFMCLIAYDLEASFASPDEIPWSVLAQTSLVLLGIWVPVGLSAATQKIEEHRELVATPLCLCPACKKIRDDQGTWKKIEEYVKEETGRETTMAMCLDCRKRWVAGQAGRAG